LKGEEGTGRTFVLRSAPGRKREEKIGRKKGERRKEVKRERSVSGEPQTFRERPPRNIGKRREGRELRRRGRVYAGVRAGAEPVPVQGKKTSALASQNGLVRVETSGDTKAYRGGGGKKRP